MACRSTRRCAESSPVGARPQSVSISATVIQRPGGIPRRWRSALLASTWHHTGRIHLCYSPTGQLRGDGHTLPGRCRRLGGILRTTSSRIASCGPSFSLVGLACTGYECIDCLCSGYFHAVEHLQLEFPHLVWVLKQQHRTCDWVIQYELDKVVAEMRALVVVEDDRASHSVYDDFYDFCRCSSRTDVHLYETAGFVDVHGD